MVATLGRAPSRAVEEAGCYSTYRRLLCTRCVVSPLIIITRTTNNTSEHDGPSPVCSTGTILQTNNARCRAKGIICLFFECGLLHPHQINFSENKISCLTASRLLLDDTTGSSFTQNQANYTVINRVCSSLFGLW
jgi:hypothetical protein